jgi:hypothetical protein
MPERFEPHDGGNGKLRVETTHVVLLVIERTLVKHPSVPSCHHP